MSAITSRPTAPPPSSSRRAPPGDPGAQHPARPDHRQRRADQQLLRPRVGAVVDPGRVEAGAVEHRHQDDRDERRPERHQGQARADLRARPHLGNELQPDQQQEGPEDVELLLDRQRPEVVERLRRRELGEVGDVMEDQPPVLEVEERAARGLAEVGGLVRADHGHPGHDHDQQHDQRREQAPRPGEPEPREVDPPPSLHLREQQVGDQVAAEGEEDADPQQAAGDPVGAEVVGEYAQHCDCPQTIESGHVALAGLDWLGHGWLPLA